MIVHSRERVPRGRGISQGVCQPSAAQVNPTVEIPDDFQKSYSTNKT